MTLKLQKMLDELRITSNLFQVALDRYLNACLAVKYFYTEAPSPTYPQKIIGSRLVNELSVMLTYETKLRESKMAILHSINQAPDVVPINKLPTDILIYVFQLLVDTLYGLPDVDNEKIPKYPLSLSHVCARWRKIISESPSLWSCIRINSYLREDKRLIAYTSFHTTRARQALMDIYIVDEFSTNPQFLGLFEFVEPFSRRIRSLELQMKRYRSPDETHRAQGYLLTEYLKAGAGSLKRLSLITQFMRESDSERPHRFIESTSNPSDRNGLGLYLPHSDLEEILHPISELWLAGLYFNWTSKAYRGLTLLRLEEGSCSIPESQLLEILASSPQLRWLDIGLKISQDTASPEPIHLPHLEVLVDTENIPLLRLVYPGSNELTLSIPGTDTATLDTIQSTRLKDFVSHANVTTFYSSDFLRNTSDVHYLLSIAPSIRILALSYFIFTDALVQVVHDSRATVILDKLFILNECKLECSALRSMIGTYRVKKLVFWGCPTDCHGHDAWNEQTLTEELSDLGDVSIQFIPESDDSILDQFLGPII